MFVVGEGAEAFGEVGFIYGAELIENDLAGLFLELTIDARGVVSAACGHGSDNHRGDIGVRQHIVEDMLVFLASEERQPALAVKNDIIVWQLFGRAWKQMLCMAVANAI